MLCVFRAPAPTKTKAQKAAAASSSGKGKKKKWSKGKVKDKAQNLIVLDKPTYDRSVLVSFKSERELWSG